GFAHTFHLSFLAFIPPAVWGLIRLDFVGLAVAILLLSKWRMFAVHPRHWINHIRANAVDIIVGLSFLEFITESNSLFFQILWVVIFEIWMLFIKPGSSNAAVASQALIGQTVGLAALFTAFEAGSLVFYVLAVWLICYFSARHFLGIFEERHGSLISSIWAFLAAALMWVLSHWLLFFGPVAQPAVLISVIGFGLAGLYYLDQYDRLAVSIKRQVILAMMALIFIIIVFSDWGDKTI
ncbi:MAG TPA: hypothetical protein VFX86_01330, partial [Candidatus Saccharimonadales bacterium]|nr:hypothetical protein [Candidatus Saccharimonadales bacterium]